MARSKVTASASAVPQESSHGRNAWACLESTACPCAARIRLGAFDLHTMTGFLSRRSLLSSLLSLWPGLSLALEAPAGPVVLTLSGRLGRSNRESRALFDMSMLAALPQHSVVQKTPWYSGPRKFTGPLLRDVLAVAQAQGYQIEAIAINDYKVSIPMEDVQTLPVILARLLDDQPMPLRDKGPLFVIYPFESHPRLRNTLYYSRCIWQLKSLDIR